MTTDFDYKELAVAFKQQAESLVPSDISKENSIYIQNLLYNFSTLAGEALYNDKKSNLDEDQNVFIVQIIAEWCFHKSIDLIRANIPSQHWDNILQKLAFTIFEISKEALKRELPEQDITAVVEHHVNKVYKECITELLEKKEIDNEIYNKAVEESNIDKMALDETKSNKLTPPKAENKKTPSIKKFYKKVTKNINKTTKFIKRKTINGLLFIKDTIEMFIAFIYFYLKQKTNRILIYLIFITIGIFNVYTNKIMELAQQFNIELSTIKIALYIIIVLVILKTIIKTIMTAVNADVQEHLNKLEETKRNLKELTNPDKQFDRLGVDILSLGVGRNLIQITDPDQEGELPARIIALRQTLTDTLGYIIPNVRIMDSYDLEPNEFRLYIRQEVITSGYVYPYKLMVLEKDLKANNIAISDNYIAGTHYITQEPCYWIEEYEIETKKIKTYKPEEVIINTLKEIVIKEVDTILSSYDIEKYLNKAKETEQARVLIDALLKEIQTNDIRKVFANLIREKISVKDILFILDRLNDYARKEKNPNILSEMIRADFARHISQKYTDKTSILNAITLSTEWEQTLNNSLQQNEIGEVFLRTSTQLEKLIEVITKTLDRTYRTSDKYPVILCSPQIRLPLYKLLTRYLPNITVIAHSELVNEVKIEVVANIK